MDRVARLRCPKDTDAARRGEHLAIDVRLPLGMRELGEVMVRNGQCVCGAEMVLGEKGVSNG
jgi:hypothetical protein